jgi:protease-4
MRRLIVGLFAVIGGLVILSVVAAVLVLVTLRPGAPRLPERIVLAVDLRHEFPDGPDENPLLRVFHGGGPSLKDLLDAVAAAAVDPRVKGLFAHVGGGDFGLAHTQELRDAIAAFRAKGKFAIAFADSFGEFGPGTRPYYLATAFDRIWLQPMGSVGLIGLYSEVPFLRGTLDLLGIVPQFDRREAFKTAVNSLTEKNFTAAHREEVEALIASLGGQIVAGIATGRKLAPEVVRAAIDRGPLLDTEALASRLVDRLGYRDEAAAAARQLAGGGARLVPLATYLEAGGPPAAGPRIALIYGSGLIVRGGDATNPLSGAGAAPADRIARAFAAAARDPLVRAILFRVDSPGGSVVASETIWRAVVRAQQGGKPVVVSMGEVAGSGGYYIAAAADKIVAEPATLTGSIGVLAGKLVVAGFLKKLGAAVDSAQQGADAGMFSAVSEFSPAGHARLEAFLDADYQGFKNHVAAGRHMSADAVEAIAKGRVWTGEQAKARGLVDALGGYETALALVRAAARIPIGAPINLAVYPPPQGPVEFVFDRLFGRRREEGGGPGVVGRAIAAAAPLIERLDALLDGPVAALMPALGPFR